MLRLVPLALMLLADAACSTSVPRTQSASSEATAEGAPGANSPDQRKICRDPSTTGSYGPRHVCRTKAEWDKIDANG
jgi:hypothetical protein